MSKNGGGFTILETMIVLAISGSMLAIVAVLFRGQQRTTQFNQAIRDMESRVLDTINDVSTGYYPNSTASCTHGASGPVFNTGASVEQGTNLGCVYIGKAIHFNENKFAVYTIVGNRYTTSGGPTPASTISESQPKVASHLTEERGYPWGINITDIYTDNDVSAGSAMLLLESTLNNTDFVESTNGYNSGVQKVVPLVSGIGSEPPVTVLTSSTDASLAIKNINSFPSGGKLTICFEDSDSGDGRQHGGIIIEGVSRPLSARIQTDNDSPKCT